jgi:hypothetical protein
MPHCQIDKMWDFREDKYDISVACDGPSVWVTPGRVDTKRMLGALLL